MTTFSLKRKIADLIQREIDSPNLISKDAKERDEIIDTLLAPIEGDLKKLESDVSRARKQRRKQTKDEEHARRKKIVAQMCRDQLHDVDLMGMKFCMTCEGKHWAAGDTCEYCYARDERGNCDDSDHHGYYGETFTITGVDGWTVYSHNICLQQDVEHSDEKFFAFTGRAKFDLEIGEMRWRSVCKSPADFARWICDVHELFFTKFERPHDHYDAEFLHEAMTKRIIEIVEDESSDDGEEENKEDS